MHGERTVKAKISYDEFLKSKVKRFVASGFDVAADELSPHLFDFQRWIVETALRKGRYAVFADCGLGKTLIQLVWADKVVERSRGPVLILAPLAVSGQTIKEGEKFGIKVSKYAGIVGEEIYISNYEQLENIDCSQFAGIVLDESSIIKNFDGKTRDLIIDQFKDTPYKLACTATPSPNDVMELGNHAEFLTVMTRNEMLSMYFVHDGGETAKWRLKGHAESDFWAFVASWSVMLARPQDLGFTAEGYELPELTFIEERIETEKRDNGLLFNDTAVSATNFNEELRLTKVDRLGRVAEIVNASKESFIIWVKQNEEADLIAELVPDAVEVRGSDSTQHKEDVVAWFTGDKCRCQLSSKYAKLLLCQNLATNNSTTKSTEIPSSNTQKTGNKNTANTAKITCGNITTSTAINGMTDHQRQMQNEMLGAANGTPTIPSIEKNARQRQRSSLSENLKPGLETCSKSSTGSRSSSTTNCSDSKTTPAQSASGNRPLSTSSNGSTLTTVTQPAISEDSSAQTATSPLVNSKTVPNCSDGQSHTCGHPVESHRVLVSKARMFGYGLNFQNCHNQVFASLDFSFEGLYQAIRRSYRFGQEHAVNIYLITTDTMQNVIDAIERKEEQFKIMQTQMIQASSEHRGDAVAVYEGQHDEFETEDCRLRKGDCVRLIHDVASESVGFSIFSPPFASLYTYSDKIEDMGNCASYDEFEYAFSLMVEQLYRVMWSGRNIAVHCMDLPIQKGKEGFIGLRDFSGLIRETFEKHGFIYHSRVTIWKNPVTEMQRTKALGLLHKQLKKDSAMSRVGIPDYLMVFRKPGEHQHPVNCMIDVDTWQQWASPVWMDIDYGDTLNIYEAREQNDERHICPLQLPTIERTIALWSNEGDTVLTPFMGIGSEAYQAVKMRRKAIGFELKDSYFDTAVRNVSAAIAGKNQMSILDLISG